MANPSGSSHPVKQKLASPRVPAPAPVAPAPTVKLAPDGKPIPAVATPSQQTTFHVKNGQEIMTHQDSVINAANDPFPKVRYSPAVVAEADRLKNPAKYVAAQRSADSTELAKYNIDRARPKAVKEAEDSTVRAQNRTIDSIVTAGGNPSRSGFTSTQIYRAKAAGKNRLENASLLAGAAAANGSLSGQDISKMGAKGQIIPAVATEMQSTLTANKPQTPAAPKPATATAPKTLRTRK